MLRNEPQTDDAENGDETENRFERHVELVETVTVACVGYGENRLDA